MADKPSAPPRDPTIREIRATLGRLYSEIDNTGSKHTGELLRRVYDHFAFVLDAYLFDVDDWADDGGRGDG